MNILQKIFINHYEEMKYILHPRSTVLENVEKMINCGDPSYGGAMYSCGHCGELKFVPFRCKSRFCPTCGNMYSIDRTTSMSFKIIYCKHRHCVFTIPEELRSFFLKDRSLLNCLFHAVRSVVLRMFSKVNKAELFVPGFICVLHTFGRSLQWNPHIHCLVSEGATGNFTAWRPFKQMKSYIYKHCPNGFYVRAKPNKCDPNTVIKYIRRYLGRPVIAIKRIDSYDGTNVTFRYNRHEDEKLMIETIPVLDFVVRLIQHIPEKHFKMIRYYGIYARHLKEDSKLRRAI